MKRASRSSVRKYHDRVAGRYDDSYDDAYWQWHDTLTWDHLKAFLPTDLSQDVVDLGCGTGKWGAKLLASGFRVTFVDISPQMLDAARLKPASPTQTARATFIQADLIDLSALPHGRFALATAFGEPIGCTESPAQAMRQIADILRPGGVLVATFDNRFACLEHYLENADVDALERFVVQGRTHWLTADPSERFEIWTHGPEDVRRLVEGAGLELVDLVGKTVLPMRRYRSLLDDPRTARRLIALEKKLWRDPAALGRAAHLQAVARKPVVEPTNAGTPAP